MVPRLTIRSSRGMQSPGPATGHHEIRDDPWSSPWQCQAVLSPGHSHAQRASKGPTDDTPGKSRALYRRPACGVTSCSGCPPLGLPTPPDADRAFALPRAKPTDWSPRSVRQRNAASSVSGRAPLYSSIPGCPQSRRGIENAHLSLESPLERPPVRPLPRTSRSESFPLRIGAVNASF